MKRWASQFKKLMTEEGRKSINIALVSANNHYASFGHVTANIFRKMICLKEVKWHHGENMKDLEDKRHTSNSIRHSKQSTLRFYGIRCISTLFIIIGNQNNGQLNVYLCWYNLLKIYYLHQA